MGQRSGRPMHGPTNMDLHAHPIWAPARSPPSPATLITRHPVSPVTPRHPQYIQYLTKPKAYGQILKRLVLGERRNRFVPED
jgi:hypothetical protein